MATAAAGYVIRGGEAGKRRLELLARVLWPTTLRLLRRAGVRPGMRCLDLGCGGGDVTLALARMTGIPPTGVDLDQVKLAAARQEAARQGLDVDFREGNVADLAEDAAYDLVYARFVLTHLRNPAVAVERARHALRPGGALVVEDIDFTGSFCYPPSAAYEKYCQLYRAAVERRGADPDIGPKLFGILRQAGLADLHVELVQPVHTGEEGKEVSLSTLINIASAVVEEGLATAGELDATIAELEAFTKRPDTLIGFPRIFQVWGRRAA
jgi:SAM-dependent methyltransferase